LQQQVSLFICWLFLDEPVAKKKKSQKVKEKKKLATSSGPLQPEHIENIGIVIEVYVR